MCYTHTLYHACGCYSKPQIFGEPCIRASAGAGLSGGCWDKVDMGVDSVDSICARCLGLRLRKSSAVSNLSARSMSGYDSDATTLVDPRRGSQASTASSTSMKVEEDRVRSHSPSACRSAGLLTPPSGAGSGVGIKRVSSTSSFSSISSTISAQNSVEHAQSLLASLPPSIPSIRRNSSGVGLSVYWRAQNAGAKSKLALEEDEVENLHWRAYDDAVYMRMSRA